MLINTGMFSLSASGARDDPTAIDGDGNGDGSGEVNGDGSGTRGGMTVELRTGVTTVAPGLGTTCPGTLVPTVANIVHVVHNHCLKKSIACNQPCSVGVKFCTGMLVFSWSTKLSTTPTSLRTSLATSEHCNKM